MSQETFLSKLRSFLGFHAQPPRNDFRNPIWGSDDDDDDGDELYSRNEMRLHSDLDLHREIMRLHDMFSSFGGMFGDMKTFFNDDFSTFLNDGINDHEHAGSVPQHFTNPDQPNSNKIRDYYLKPGYHSRKPFEQKDIDLDGKISSSEISGLLKKQEESNGDNPGTIVPFDSSKFSLPRSFCRTIITTSVTKPDGTVETRKIIKNGSEVIEDTVTSTEPDLRGPGLTGPGISTISSTGILLSELAQIFKNFY